MIQNLQNEQWGQNSITGTTKTVGFNSDRQVKVWRESSHSLLSWATVVLITKSSAPVFLWKHLWSQSIRLERQFKKVKQGVWPLHRAAQTRLNANGRQTLSSWFEFFSVLLLRKKTNPQDHCPSPAIIVCFLRKESLPLFGSQKMS